MEGKDSDNRPDEEVALEAWEFARLREDSVVIDKFHGQLKSHVTCLNCGKESTTFDGYGTLSVPIPVKTTKTVQATLFPLPYGSQPQTVAFEMPTTATVGTFREALQAASSSSGGSDGSHYQFGTVYKSQSGRVDKNLKDADFLHECLRYDDLYIFEVLLTRLLNHKY